MAVKINLFERVESGKGLFAVESISLIYNALTTILIFLLYTRMERVYNKKINIVVRAL